MDTIYSWVLVTASTISFTLVAGNIKTLGVLYAEMLKYFGSGAGNTAWVTSLALFMLFALGPVANHLCIVYTFRRVLFTGGILGSAGYLLTSFITHIEIMYLTIGIVTGVGYGLMFSPTLTIANFYVEKRRALANGLIVTGSGIGVVVFPYLYRYLINKYGLRGSFMVISAVVFHTCAAALIVRQPAILARKKGYVPEENQNMSSGNLEKRNSNKVERGVVKEKSTCGSKLALLDLSVFRIPSFTLFSLVFLLQLMSNISIVIMLPAHIISCGYEDEQADFVMSMSGVGDIFSKLLFGWLADKATKQRKYFVAFTAMLSGVSAIAITFVEWYPALIIYGITVGTFSSAFPSLMSVIVIDIVGMKRFPSAIGKINFLFSLGSLVNPPISGWFKDLTGSWLLSLRLNGCLSLIAGILALLDPLVTKYWCCSTK